MVLGSGGGGGGAGGGGSGAATTGGGSGAGGTTKLGASTCGAGAAATMGGGSRFGTGLGGGGGGGGGAGGAGGFTRFTNSGAASLTAWRTASTCISAQPASTCALSTPTTSVWRATPGNWSPRALRSIGGNSAVVIGLPCALRSERFGAAVSEGLFRQDQLAQRRDAQPVERAAVVDLDLGIATQDVVAGHARARRGR